MTRDEQVHHYLCLFNHLNYLHLYSKWVGSKREVGLVQAELDGA